MMCSSCRIELLIALDSNNSWGESALYDHEVWFAATPQLQLGRLWTTAVCHLLRMDLDGCKLGGQCFRSAHLGHGIQCRWYSLIFDREDQPYTTKTCEYIKRFFDQMQALRLQCCIINHLLSRVREFVNRALSLD
jgi:hypothetical protein